MATSNKTEQEDGKKVRTYATYGKPMSDRFQFTMLILGDILVFLIFSVIGRRSHGEATGTAILQVIGTAAPFAIAWFIVSPFFGLFKRKVVVSPKQVAWRTAVAWLIAWLIGLTIRSLYLKYFPPVTFALITLISNMFFLLIWRWPFAIRNTMQKEPEKEMGN
jgi:hypothetical protein